MTLDLVSGPRALSGRWPLSRKKPRAAAHAARTRFADAVPVPTFSHALFGTFHEVAAEVVVEQELRLAIGPDARGGYFRESASNSRSRAATGWPGFRESARATGQLVPPAPTSQGAAKRRRRPMLRRDARATTPGGP